MKTIVDYASKVKEQHALNKTLAPVETDLTSASKAYAVGQKFIHDGVLYQAKTAIAQGAALVLNTNYEAADDVSSEIEALTNNVNVLIENGAVNYNINRIVSQTKSGITFTVNSDDSITLLNTATADIFRSAVSVPSNADGVKQKLPKGTWKYSLSDSAISGITLIIKRADTSIDIGRTTEKALIFTLAEDTEVLVDWKIDVGTAFATAKTLYPQIVPVSYNGPYVPYAKTNRELTAENQTLTNNVGVLAENGAVNRLPFDLNKCKVLNTTGTWNNNTYTLNGISFTVNSDNTIAVITESGGSTASTQFILFESVANWHNMMLSGAPSTASATTYDLAAYDTQTSGENSCRPNAVILSNITDGHTIRVFIRVRSGQVITEPITFNPMIADANYSGDYVPYAMTNRELTEILSDVGTYNVPVIICSARNNYVRGAIIYHDKTAKHTVAINEVKQFADSTDYTSQFSVDYSNAGFAIIYSATVALAGALMNVNVTIS